MAIATAYLATHGFLTILDSTSRGNLGRLKSSCSSMRQSSSTRLRCSIQSLMDRGFAALQGSFTCPQRRLIVPRHFGEPQRQGMGSVRLE